MPYNPQTGQWETEEDDVATEVSRVVSSGSPIIQQARTRGAQAANRRGLGNSSMAIGAAEAAAYDVAVPIASQQSSQTHQKNLSSQQNREQLRIQDRSDAAAQTRLETDIQSRERINTENNQQQERLQGRQFDFERSQLTAQIGSAERLQAAELAEQKQRLGMQLTSDERIALEELRAAQERTETEIAGQITLQELDAATRSSLLEAELGSRERLQQAELAEQRFQLGLTLTSEEQRAREELESAERRLTEQLRVESGTEQLRIFSQERMLTAELGSRERVQEAILANERLLQGEQLTAQEQNLIRELDAALERLETEVTSRESVAREQIASEERIANLDASTRERLLEQEIGSRERLQEAILANDRFLQGEQISAQEENLIRELQSAEARVASQVSAQRDISAAQLVASQNIAGLDRQSQQLIAELNREVDERIAALNVSEESRRSAAAAMVSFESTYADQVSAIVSNPDFDAATRQNLLNSVARIRNSNAALVEQLYGISFDYSGDGSGGQGGSPSDTFGGLPDTTDPNYTLPDTAGLFGGLTLAQIQELMDAVRNGDPLPDFADNLVGDGSGSAPPAQGGGGLGGAQSPPDAVQDPVSPPVVDPDLGTGTPAPPAPPPAVAQDPTRYYSDGTVIPPTANTGLGGPAGGNVGIGLPNPENPAPAPSPDVQQIIDQADPGDAQRVRDGLAGIMQDASAGDRIASILSGDEPMPEVSNGQRQLTAEELRNVLVFLSNITPQSTDVAGQAPGVDHDVSPGRGVGLGLSPVSDVFNNPNRDSTQGQDPWDAIENVREQLRSDSNFVYAAGGIENIAFEGLGRLGGLIFEGVNGIGSLTVDGIQNVASGVVTIIEGIGQNITGGGQGGGM